MTRTKRKKIRINKRLYVATILLVLSAATGIGLYRLPPSLLDVDGFSRFAADKLFSASADRSSAEAVLRGTIYDRNLNELAVSYQLYSLYVRPSEITEREKFIRTLSEVTGLDEGELEIRLNSGGSLVKISDNLEAHQVEAVDELRKEGLYSKPVEERFYPEHENGADLLGYAGEGTGLAGIEAACDTVLQHGDFRSSSVPEIDFKGSAVLGSSKLDLVLTLDMEIQKEVEHSLRDYLEKNGATRGLALVMNVRTGAVLAWASRPSFNPNYFWQANGKRQVSLFQEKIDGALMDDMLFRTAAAGKYGEKMNILPPETVAAPDYGLLEDEIKQYRKMFGLSENEQTGLPVCSSTILPPEEQLTESPGKDGVRALRLAAASAAMLNGGWKVQPYVLDSIYDEAQMTSYQRSEDHDAAVRSRILPPAAGIRARMNLLHDRKAAAGDFFLYTGSSSRMLREGSLSRYILQDMVIGAIPAKSPEYVMLMITGQDNLYPLPAGVKSDPGALAGIGEKLLPRVSMLAAQETQLGFPERRDTSNYNRFLISRRIDFQEEQRAVSGNGPIMPQVTGLSLRKGLQRLDAFNLEVRIEGSGRIVTQHPPSGKSLDGVSECRLVLDSNI